MRTFIAVITVLFAFASQGLAMPTPATTGNLPIETKVSTILEGINDDATKDLRSAPQKPVPDRNLKEPRLQ